MHLHTSITLFFNTQILSFLFSRLRFKVNHLLLKCSSNVTVSAIFLYGFLHDLKYSVTICFILFFVTVGLKKRPEEFFPTIEHT